MSSFFPDLGLYISKFILTGFEPDVNIPAVPQIKFALFKIIIIN